jgi:hypothetical protein
MIVISAMDTLFLVKSTYGLFYLRLSGCKVHYPCQDFLKSTSSRLSGQKEHLLSIRYGVHIGFRDLWLDIHRGKHRFVQEVLRKDQTLPYRRWIRYPRTEEIVELVEVVANAGLDLLLPGRHADNIVPFLGDP